MKMRKLQNEEEYDAAVRRVEELLPLVADDTLPDDPILRELEELSISVADYSDEYFSLN